MIFHNSIDKLLQIFKIDDKYIGICADAIFDLISEINNWVNLTGKEFLVDTKMFRLGVYSTINNPIDNIIK